MAVINTNKLSENHFRFESSSTNTCPESKNAIVVQQHFRVVVITVTMFHLNTISVYYSSYGSRAPHHTQRLHLTQAEQLANG